MKKQYLDYAGLKRVLKHLLPGARKIWHGTLDEWKALSEAERDKYDQAEVIDGSGYQSDYPYDYVRNLHDPDFSGAITETRRDFPLDSGSSITYTCPKRGFVFIVAESERNSDVFLIKMSSVPLQFSSYAWLPANKGDVIRITNKYSQALDHASYSIVFVPYKVQ